MPSPQLSPKWPFRSSSCPSSCLPHTYLYSGLRSFLILRGRLREPHFFGLVLSSPKPESKWKQ